MPSQFYTILLLAAAHLAVSFPSPHHQTYQRIPIPLYSSPNDATVNNEEVQRLKQSAELLRAQAMAAQEELASKRSAMGSRAGEVPVKIVEYKTVADSCWEIT